MVCLNRQLTSYHSNGGKTKPYRLEGAYDSSYTFNEDIILPNSYNNPPSTARRRWRAAALPAASPASVKQMYQTRQDLPFTQPPPNNTEATDIFQCTVCKKNCHSENEVDSFQTERLFITFSLSSWTLVFLFSLSKQKAT